MGTILEVSENWIGSLMNTPTAASRPATDYCRKTWDRVSSPSAHISANNAISQTAIQQSGDCARADREWMAGFGRSDC